MIKEKLIKDYVEKPIKKYWDVEAYTDLGQKTFKYSDVAEKIMKIHIILEYFGIQRGDKISLIGKNSAYWAMTYLGIITYGAVVVPILPDFHSNEMHHIINHSDSKMVFLSERMWEKIDPESIDVKVIYNMCHMVTYINNTEKENPDFEKIFMEKYPEFQAQNINFKDISNEELVAISYTSGSTGFSKGVMLPANSLAANIKFAWNNMRLDPGDKIVSILPLAHTFGCAFDFLWPFSKGAHVHFLTRMPTPTILLKAYQEVKPNLILSVPLIIEKIYKKKILPQISKNPVKTLLNVPVMKQIILNKVKKSLTEAFGGQFREIVLGGAPLSKEVADFFRMMKFNLTIGYGMTECGPLISYSNWQKTLPDSCGKLVDTLEIKIDSNNPFKEPGEIMVRGENVMLGYYKNPEATKQAIDSEGWLHTGDLGLIDENNNIFIKGRIKSMILGPSGENIYPEEIEAIINNKDYVDESLVISDQKHKLIALIHPDYELMDANNKTLEEVTEIILNLKDEINNDLPAYKQISKIKIFPNEFEKTPKKNIKRFLYQRDV